MDRTRSGAVEYVRQLNVDDSASGESNPRTLSLLELPLEVRRHIYSYFLKCPRTDQIEGSDTKSIFDFRVMFVRQQMLDEALEYLLRANRWIEYRRYPLVEERDDSILECADPVAIPLDLLPTRGISALSSQITLTIHVGKECGLEKLPTEWPAERKVFAYNRRNWVQVCVALANGVDKYRNISIDLATELHNDYEALFPDFLGYLSLIRGADKVHFHGLMSDPLFKQMAFNMARPLTLLQVMQEYFKGLHEQGDFEISRKDVESARHVYTLGCLRRHEVVVASSRQMDASDVSLVAGVWQLYNELLLSTVTLTNDRIDRLKINGSLPRDRIDLFVQNWHFATVDMFVWPNLPDEHRRRIHHERGRLLCDLAEYMKIPRNTEYAKAKFDDFPPFGIAQKDNLYNLAAHEFMFAADLETVDGGRSWKMWQEVNREFDAEANWKRKIHIQDIPGHGAWRGDARWLACYWMDQNLTRLWPPAAFCFQDEEELKLLKDELGITWRDAGLLRLVLAGQPSGMIVH